MKCALQDNSPRSYHGSEIDVPSVENDEVVLLDPLAIKCYDNRYGEDQNPADIKVNSIDKKNQLETWMQVTGITQDDQFAIEAKPDVDYTHLTEVIGEMNEIGIKKFFVKTTLKESKDDVRTMPKE